MTYILIEFNENFIQQFYNFPQEHMILSLHARNVEDIIWNKISPEIIDHSMEISFFIKELKKGNSNAIRMIFARNHRIKKINRTGFVFFDQLKKIAPIWGNHRTDFLIRSEAIKKDNLKNAIIYLSEGIEWHKNGEINELKDENSIEVSEKYYETIRVDYGIAERNSILRHKKNKEESSYLISKKLAKTYKNILSEYDAGLLTKNITEQKIENDDFNGFF